MTITRSFLTHPGPDHPPKRISTSFPLTSARRWWPYIKQSVPSFLYSGTNRSNVSSGGLMLIFQVPNGFLQQQRQGSFDTLCTNGKTPQDCKPPQLTDPCPRARLSHAAFRVKAPQCLWSLSAWNNSSQPELSHRHRDFNSLVAVGSRNMTPTPTPFRPGGCDVHLDLRGFARTNLDFEGQFLQGLRPVVLVRDSLRCNQETVWLYHLPPT